MSCRQLRIDLSLFRQGIVIGSEFGAHALGSMVRVAEFLETSIYKRGSLRALGNGRFGFTLVNPPMRLGAFSWARLSWNGTALDPTLSTVGQPGQPHRSFEVLNRSDPLVLGIGEPMNFEGPLADGRPGEKGTVTLELQNVAIPPKVWIRFTDELRP